MQAIYQLACIMWLASITNPRTCKFLPNILFKINSDQNICACLFLILDVHAKFVDNVLLQIWHEGSAYSPHH